MSADPDPRTADLGFGLPAALTMERLKAALDARDWQYQVFEDGSLGGYWDGNPFYFLLDGAGGQTLHIRGRWRRPIALQVRPQLLLTLDHWHMTRIWPKASTLVDANGTLWVQADHAVDWTTGVTDAQLAATVDCAILNALALFRELARQVSTNES
jgi:hypothetical protein